MKPYIGLYGPVQMLKAYCPRCKGVAFILGGVFACCDLEFNSEDELARRFKRECDCDPVRTKGPKKSIKEEILRIQEDRCFYCNQQLGGKSFGRSLKLHWDHMVPHAYSMNNLTENYVAACQTCNLWKGAIVFDTVDQARVYLAGKWEKHIHERTKAIKETQD